MSKDNSDKEGIAAAAAVDMSKQPMITISMQLFPDGRLQLTGPYNNPPMFLGVLEIAKNLVHKQTSGEKPPQNIVIPTGGGTYTTAGERCICSPSHVTPGEQDMKLIAYLRNHALPIIEELEAENKELKEALDHELGNFQK